MTDAIIDRVLVEEGWPTVTNRAADRGGLTKGGITKPALAAFLGRDVTDDELRNLDEATARQIYALDYIVRPGFSHVDNVALRAFLVDVGVMSGQHEAVRLAQATLGHDLTTDGILGSHTLSAMNAADPRSFLRDLIVARVVWLDHVAQHDTTQIGNLAGWHNRTLAYLKDAA